LKIYSRLAAGVLLLALASVSPPPARAVPTVRIKDIGSIQGLRDNQLTGIGLVTGLAGKGDSSNSGLLRSAIANLVANFGFMIDPADVRSKNCAVVMVSSTVPPFVREGDYVDVLVSSLGDARSLEGGVLLQTPLQGANAQIYAVAQGKLAVAAGSTAGGAAGSASAAGRTVGTIPGGAVVEREILSSFLQDNTVSILLRHPDFVIANAVAQAVRERFTDITLQAVDPSRIEIEIPEGRRQNPVGFIAELESIEVAPDPSGKVVIDSASGVIIFGERVRIGKVAVSYRDVTVNVGAAGAYAPRSGSFGTAASAAFGEQERQHFTFGETTTVEELVETLRAIGLGTEAIIPIIQAIDKAGALFGKLVIM
jgi:flagellar P-ring protein precursor FlgI